MTERTTNRTVAAQRLRAPAPPATALPLRRRRRVRQRTSDRLAGWFTVVVLAAFILVPAWGWLNGGPR